MPGKKKKYNARFPPARIKKIMQSDEEVGKVAAAVPVIISRALELFVENMLKKANEVTSRRGARTLTPSHLKFCINSESRFDFLKELVSGVPDLQGDMDINLDAVPTNSTGSEPISPQVITPVPSTTSSITWPSEYSGVSSHALPSNSSAIVTSSLNSPSVAASVSMVSQQYSKSSLKNNLHRNNNTSRSSTGYLKDETLQTTRTDNNAPDSKDSLNTKGIRKRGRPRKLSTDASAPNKPKKPKTSQDDDNSYRDQEVLPVVHATQYSLSYKQPSETTLTDLDDKLTQTKETEKIHNEAALRKSISLSENSAPEKLRQFSRTYSTGSTASQNSSSLPSNTTSIPSFTLTYPMIPTNTEPEINSKILKKTEKSSSSQIEIHQPKLKNYSKGSMSAHDSQKDKTNHGHISNNGFPFTITNILEKQLTSNRQTVTEEGPVKENAKPESTVQVNNALDPKPKGNAELLSNINTTSYTEKTININSASEKAAIPPISWTMNVVAPKINISEEVDEDYDA